MRHRTGLHNRFRDGRGTYSRQHKSTASDRYGRWNQGRRNGPETVAGKHVDWLPVTRES